MKILPETRPQLRRDALCGDVTTDLDFTVSVWRKEDLWGLLRLHGLSTLNNKNKSPCSSESRCVAAARYAGL